MTAATVTACRACCDGPDARPLPVGWVGGIWNETGLFEWTLEDLDAEVAARIGPDWRRDAARDLTDEDQYRRPTYRAFYAWDDHLLIIHAVGDAGDAFETREECGCGGFTDCCEAWPHVGYVTHYVGPSWRLTLDLVTPDAMRPVGNRAELDAALGI